MLRHHIRQPRITTTSNTNTTAAQVAIAAITGQLSKFPNTVAGSRVDDDDVVVEVFVIVVDVIALEGVDIVDVSVDVITDADNVGDVADVDAFVRSEERRVGKECCR